MFALLSQAAATQELWTTGVAGARVLSEEEVVKYKMCSPNGMLTVGTDIVPYSSITANPKDKGYVALNAGNHAEDNYSSVTGCSNPTW